MYNRDSFAKMAISPEEVLTNLHECCILTNHDETFCLDYQINGYAYLNSISKPIKWLLVKQENVFNGYTIHPVNDLSKALTYSEFKNAALVLPFDKKLSTQYWGVSHNDTLYPVIEVDKELDLDRLPQKLGSKARLVKRIPLEQNLQSNNQLATTKSGKIIPENLFYGQSKDINDNNYPIRTTKVEIPVSVISEFKNNKELNDEPSSKFYQANLTLLKSKEQNVIQASQLLRQKKRPEKNRRLPDDDDQQLQKITNFKASQNKTLKEERQRKIVNAKINELQKTLDKEANNWIRAYEKATGTSFQSDVKIINKLDKTMSVRRRIDQQNHRNGYQLSNKNDSENLNTDTDSIIRIPSQIIADNRPLESDLAITGVTKQQQINNNRNDQNQDYFEETVVRPSVLVNRVLAVNNNLDHEIKYMSETMRQDQELAKVNINVERDDQDEIFRVVL